jgi:hypothetical protein
MSSCFLPGAVSGFLLVEAFPRGTFPLVGLKESNRVDCNRWGGIHWFSRCS